MPFDEVEKNEQLDWLMRDSGHSREGSISQCLQCKGHKSQSEGCNSKWVFLNAGKIKQARF